MRPSHSFLALALTLSSLTAVKAQEEKPRKSSIQSKANKVPMKTFGGRQFWGDLYYFHEWRIQQNVLTKHHRLLDGEDVRHHSGTYEECREKLDEIRKEQKLPAMKGKAVVLVHGIVRSSKSFSAMEKKLKEEGYSVFGFDYPSTRVSIPESAEYLRKSIKSLEGIDEIYLVVHSMGGLVVRSMLVKGQDPRIKRMVMMGVPNMGAEMADAFKKNPLFKIIFGPAGQQLVTDGEGLISELPTPKFEFAILAGARGTEKGYNPLIPGDDDGTVAVSSTRLPGANDFISKPVLHSFLMFNKECIEHTSRYLKTGKFREKEPAQPIEVAPQQQIEQKRKPDEKK